MAGASTQGQGAPSNEGTGYGRTSLEGPDEEQVIVPIGVESSSVAITAHPDNSGRIYIGWDDEVTTTNGFPLGAGSSISFDLDVSQQPIWGVSDNTDDEIRYIATG